MTSVNIFTFIGAAVVGLIQVTIIAMAISLFSDEVFKNSQHVVSGFRTTPAERETIRLV